MPKPEYDVVRPYQKSGVVYLTSRPYAMLGDDTGLGKSLQCIIAADALKYRRILVLCPLIGLVSWRIELFKWQVLGRKFLPFDKAQISIPHGPLVYVLPYSTLSIPGHAAKALRLVQRTEAFDAVICDEAHYLSNWQSNRTKAVYGAWSSFAGGVIDLAKAKSVWLLSGTFQRRDARDLYPHLKALFPEAINVALRRPKGAPVKKRDYDEFFLDYDDTRFGRQIIGNNAENIHHLRDAMRPYMLARRKVDVAPELGAVTRYDLPLGIDPHDPYMAAVNHPDFGKALVEELLHQPDLHTLMALSETAAEERRILGMIKVRPAATWIEDFLLSDGGKLVVFAWHRDVIFELQERLSDWQPVTVMGGTSNTEREHAVTRFQVDPRCRIFLGQTIAASTSITLTAASTVLTLEPDWLPHNDYQANSRVHRLGQTEPVFNYRCFSDGTIDSRIIARANARYDDFEELIGGLITHNEDLPDALAH